MLYNSALKLPSWNSLTNTAYTYMWHYLTSGLVVTMICTETGEPSFAQGVLPPEGVGVENNLMKAIHFMCIM